MIPIIAPADMAKATSDWYIDYVKTNVLEPVGIQNADCKVPVSDPTLFYSFPHNDNNGIHFGNERLISGGRGWNLTVVEVAKIISRLKHTTDLLPAAFRTLMFNNLLGCFSTVDPNNGTYYWHNGILNYWGGGTPYTMGMPAGMRSVWYIFPNDIEMCLMYNSIGPLADIWPIVEDAYNESWYTK